MTTSDPALAMRLSALKRVFRPSSPVDDRKLFKGRTRELARVVSAVQELGQHAVVYGERGLGKTSLSYMARDAFRGAAPDTTLAVRIPCSADDNFATVWKKLPPRLTSESDLLSAETQPMLTALLDRVEDMLLLPDELGPDQIARALHLLSSRVPVLIVLDEFDRLGDFGSTQLFADLIKTLSDDLVRATLLIVGVADDVDGLIAGHRSVERALLQINMPRMKPEELREIVVDGFATYSESVGELLQPADEVVDLITHLSEGFPYFTHLLAGALGEIAVLRSSPPTMALLAEALTRALEETNQSIRTTYTDAVTSPKKNASFAVTLLACARAPVDELGYFAPADVRAPLSHLAGTTRDTPDFIQHLKRFSAAPSWVLETRGEGRRARYRFSNPLMRPYILIKGYRDGLLAPPAS